MDWQEVPLGMIRHDELLNALLAIWKSHEGLADKLYQDDYSQIYKQGFEEGLDAVAQLAGLTKFFEAEKNAHRATLQAKQNARPKLINGQASVIDLT